VLATITEWLKSTLLEPDPVQRTHGLHLSAAALMIEIARADHNVSENEKAAMIAALENTLSLNAAEAHELLHLANPAVDHAVSLTDFTRLLNEHLSLAERVRIIEALWQVAYADNGIDKYEEYYLRKIADLLYVSHSDFICTKLRVLKS
jgi:uncharacterized tellurite resistance protein B-like protein